jgi:hypothetical protein
MHPHPTAHRGNQDPQTTRASPNEALHITPQEASSANAPTPCSRSAPETPINLAGESSDIHEGVVDQVPSQQFREFPAIQARAISRLTRSQEVGRTRSANDLQEMKAAHASSLLLPPRASTGQTRLRPSNAGDWFKSSFTEFSNTTRVELRNELEKAKISLQNRLRQLESRKNNPPGK